MGTCPATPNKKDVSDARQSPSVPAMLSRQYAHISSFLWSAPVLFVSFLWGAPVLGLKAFSWCLGVSLGLSILYGRS